MNERDWAYEASRESLVAHHDDHLHLDENGTGRCMFCGSLMPGAFKEATAHERAWDPTTIDPIDPCEQGSQ